MLAKLTKYEFRATGRILGVMYAALVVIAVIMRIQFAINNATHSDMGMAMGMPTFIVIMLYACAIVAIGVLTFILIIQRFYKNLLQNEGYLMHTLPVKIWQHIAAKLIVSVVWCFVSMIVIFVSFMVVGSVGVNFGDLVTIMTTISFRNHGAVVANGVAFMFELLILCIAVAAASILQIYAAMSVGQLSDNHKLLCSFGAYVGINVALQIIVGIFANIFYKSSSMLYGVFENMDVNSTASFHAGMWALIALYVVKSVLFFAATNYLMKNKLNLE